jgi:thioredoxin 1
MKIISSASTLDPVYRKALKTWRPVIFYFANEHCPACELAGPVFREVAEPYRLRASIYMLNTRETPRHPDVTGTPTVLFYRDGKLQKKLKGIGNRQKLEREFVGHIGNVKAPTVTRRPRHDLAWLRIALRRLCTVHRAKGLRFM